MESIHQRITIEPGKRGGKPCIRHMRITVYDVLGWLAAGMSTADILADFPELTPEDIQAALAFAADREHHLVAFSAWDYSSRGHSKLRNAANRIRTMDTDPTVEVVEVW